ncbi:MAG: PD-(D/E)XK nuclease family protein [Candidatus Kariarchaeaceae archaeon]|jgi:CRISPR/Cas system-associated exonuclease Cas4 (RecB family)
MTQDDEPSEFEITGIDDTVSKNHQELFRKLRTIIFEKVSAGGHDYAPAPMEYRASGVGYCSRKTVLNRDPSKHLSAEEINQLPRWFLEELHPDPELIPTKFGVSVVGQVIHETIQEALQSDILAMEEQVEFDGGRFKLVGHYDLLVEDIEGKKVVIDIKSTNTSRKYLPKPSHLRQLMAYQGMLSGIDGALLYVHRNNWEMSYVAQAFNKDEFSAIIMKLSKMAAHDEKNELPPAIPESDYECSIGSFHCQYYKFCFGPFPSQNGE